MPKREDAGAPRWPLEPSLSTTACGSDQGAPPPPKPPRPPTPHTFSPVPGKPRPPGVGRPSRPPWRPPTGQPQQPPEVLPRLGAVGGREPAAWSAQRPSSRACGPRPSPPLPAETSGTRFPRGSAHLPAAGSRGLPRPDSQKTSDSSQTGGREHHVRAEAGSAGPSLGTGTAGRRDRRRRAELAEARAGLARGGAAVRGPVSLCPSPAPPRVSQSQSPAPTQRQTPRPAPRPAPRPPSWAWPWPAWGQRVTPWRVFK